MNASITNTKKKMCTRALVAGAAALLAVAGTVLASDNNSPTDPLQHTARMLEAHPNAAYDPESILVRFAPSALSAQKDAVRARVGGVKLQEWTAVPGLEQIKVQGGVTAALNTIKNMPGVMYAEHDSFIHAASTTPNDPRFRDLWALNNTGNRDINAPEAWDISSGAPGFVIATLDTGVSNTHPDLASNMWANPGEIPGNRIDDDRNGFVDDVWGWNFVANNANPRDDNGHGTQVAGIFGAVGNNNIGVTGVMWKCQIMSLKILNASGSGSVSLAISALQYAASKGVKVSNNSWSGTPYSQALLDAINATQSIGHIFVAAAGNQNRNIDMTPDYPASYNALNIISVIATDGAEKLATSSNYARDACDIAAPGSNILSTTCFPANGYSSISGTSASAAYVTGVVGLLYAEHSSWTINQLRSRVLSTARPIADLTNRCATAGILNAFAALTPPPLAPDDCSNAVRVGVGTFAFSTIGATTDGPLPDCSQITYDTWFSFTPCTSGNVTVRTCTGASWDTAIGVYTGTCSTPLLVACNDDSCGLQSSVTFSAAIGAPYLIRIGAGAAVRGTGLFTISGISCQTPAANNCVDAVAVGNGSYNSTTSGASPDGVAACNALSSRDVWYSYIAPASGVLTLDTCTAASFDTVLSVHSGCPGNAANTLACNDNATSGSCSGTSRSSLTLNVTAGTLYKIRVGGNGASSFGSFTLRIAGPLSLAGLDVPPTCPCDWDRDASLTSSDFFAFLSDFMAGTADFNNSGDVTTQDLFDYLECFMTAPGACAS